MISIRPTCWTGDCMVRVHSLIDEISGVHQRNCCFCTMYTVYVVKSLSFSGKIISPLILEIISLQLFVIPCSWLLNTWAAGRPNSGKSSRTRGTGCHSLCHYWKQSGLRLCSLVRHFSLSLWNCCTSWFLQLFRRSRKLLFFFFFKCRLFQYWLSISCIS